MSMSKTLVLFNYDFDQSGYTRLAKQWPTTQYGFDLFSFPSNARLAWFDMERMVSLACFKAKLTGAQGVTSSHEQFGALCAALLAETMGWAGTPVNAVIACQHKLYARQVLEQVAPQANIPFALLDAEYGDVIPAGIKYPAFVKPVKAAFSVLAKTVHSHAELTEHTRFTPWELWVIRHLVEPFEKVLNKRMPQVSSAHRLMVEQPVDAAQYCLDGYVFNGKFHLLGCVDSVMYPGTHAFMRFDYPSRLPTVNIKQAAQVAEQFLQAIGFTHGMFNMEFFYNPATQQCQVIEFNPRMAAQFSDLYLRVSGIDLHEVGLALAHNIDPATLPKHLPRAKVSSSYVYRLFNASEPAQMPHPVQVNELKRQYPDAVFVEFAKSSNVSSRDFKWLGSFRLGCLHLGAESWEALDEKCLQASAIVGWKAPIASAHREMSQRDNRILDK